MLLFEEEGGDQGGQGGGGSEGEGASQEPKTITLTQEELNKMMADNRRKTTQENKELKDMLNQLQNQSQMTEQEKEELSQRLEELEKKNLTQEELTKRELAKAQKEHATQLKTAQDSSEFWKANYTQATIARSLQDAAIEHKAVSPEQIVILLAGSTRLKETEDNNFAPVVDFNDVDDDGKAITLEMSPTDAVKRMVELPDKYGNLFQGNSSSGIGGDSGTGGRSPKVDLKDPEQYMKWRKENPGKDPMEVMNG